MSEASREDDLRDLTERIRRFADDRDWHQYHSPKNLAMALSVEAAEILEHFQWLTGDESRVLGDDPAKRSAVADELADVAIYLLRLADVLGVDLGSAICRKMERNEERFPPQV